MPGMPITVLPQEDRYSALAQAIAGAGNTIGQSMYQRPLIRNELAMKKRELDIKERGLKPYEDLLQIEREKVSNDFKTELAKLTYQQKKEALSTILDSVKMMDAKAATTFLSDPRVQLLFKDVGIPVPMGASGVASGENPLSAVGAGLGRIGEAMSGWFGGRKSTTPTSTNLISVINPQGKRVRINSADLAEALKQGYSQ